MRLALRHSLPADASALHRVSASAIEARLVTAYAHGGIVIGDTLYHSNGSHGVHSEVNPDLTGWVLIDLGDALDAVALDRFERVSGSGYDFFSLGAFIVQGYQDTPDFTEPSEATREELEQKAKELGIKFDGRTSDAKLNKLISESI